MDDITPDMDFDKFNKIKAILDDYGLKPLIGIVPFNKDDTLHVENCHEDFKDFLSNLKSEGWIMALHGYNHLYTTRSKGIFPINEFSEFAGVEPDIQNKMIEQGLKQLKEWGVETDVFMAPGHTFDKNTLKALKNNNINCVTDGFGKRPYIRDDIIFYPISSRRSECTEKKEGYSTYVLHANSMSDKEIDAFERLIKDNRDCFISYSEYMQVKPQYRKLGAIAKEYLMAIAKHYLVSRKASKGTVIHEAENIG